MAQQDLDNLFVKGLDLIIQQLLSSHPREGKEAIALSIELASSLMDSKTPPFQMTLALAILLRHSLGLALDPSQLQASVKQQRKIPCA